MTIEQMLAHKPRDWEIGNIGHVLAIRNDLRLPLNTGARGMIPGPYPYYGPTGELDKIDHFRVEGDFALIGEDGDHFLKYLSRSMTLWVSGKFNVNNHAHLIGSTGQCLAKWFFYFYMHTSLEPILTRQGVGRYKLTKAALEGLPIAIPSISEQEKVIDVLVAWDDAVEKLDALIAAKDRRKKALMQQLLTGKRRLKRFAASNIWKQQRLDVVFERLERKASAKVERALSITAGRGFVDQREKFSRVIAGANLENYILLKRGEFSYNKGNSDRYPQGCVYRLEEFDEGAVPNVWISFRLRSDEHSSDFYKHFFLSGGHNHQLHRSINFGVRNDGLLNLTADSFFSIKVPVPEPEEQKALGILFEHLDAELRLLRDERAALNQQKRGLMQQLLTGRKRVKTT